MPEDDDREWWPWVALGGGLLILVTVVVASVPFPCASPAGAKYDDDRGTGGLLLKGWTPPPRLPSRQGRCSPRK